MKSAMIWGVTGQAGHHLSRLLLDQGLRVIGVKRRTSQDGVGRLATYLKEKNFELVHGDITDAGSVHGLVNRFVPDYIFNLAAQSFVKCSFDEPSHTMAVTAGGCLNLLEAMRQLPTGDRQRVRLYQASSSEMFGSSCSALESPCAGDGPDFIGQRRDFTQFPSRLARLFYDKPFQDELTPFRPNSPYAVAKLAAHEMLRIYRESYGLFACSGINFNFEGPYRGEQFVTRKISLYAGRLRRAMKENSFIEPLRLGNLDARRDWSYAGDIVRGAWLAINAEEPDDYVFASGECHSVREFVEEAFHCVGVPRERALDYVVVDPAFLRPCEVPFLRGDASKARAMLGWQPTLSFSELVRVMVEHDAY